jgi:hypothetical protein
MSMRRSPLVLVLASCAIAVLATTGAAHATPGFPAVVAQTLGMSNTPPCALCHDGGRTGLGTVQTPFGKNVREYGATANDETALREALLAMDADKVSSLKDGVADTAKLRKGIDPNGGDSSAYSAAPPGYGCGGAHVARTTEGDPSWPWLAVALVIVRVRRRR